MSVPPERLRGPSRTRVDPPRGESGAGGLAGALAGALAGVLVFLVIVIGLLWFGEPRDEPDESDPPLAATPVSPSPAPATAERTEPASPTPSPTPDPSPSPSPEEESEPAERDPTDADAARFTSEFEPPEGQQVEAVTVDVTGDGRPEIVVASVARQAVRLDVATWTGTAYEVTFSDVGGRARRIERFEVRDISGNGVRDIATTQTADDGLESLALWGWDGREFVRQEARGGCWDGSHVYGAAGVDVREGEIAATCDDSPLPVSEWSTDVYVWDDGAWRLDRTEQP